MGHSAVISAVTMFPACSRHVGQCWDEKKEVKKLNC